MKKAQRNLAVRASISFPAALYETLEGIAKQKKVSMAWIVRDATAKYVVGEASEENTKDMICLAAPQPTVIGFSFALHQPEIHLS